MFAYQRVEKVQLQISTRWETSRKRDKFRILRAGAVRGYCPRAKDEIYLTFSKSPSV